MSLNERALEVAAAALAKEQAKAETARKNHAAKKAREEMQRAQEGEKLNEARKQHALQEITTWFRLIEANPEQGITIVEITEATYQDDWVEDRYWNGHWTKVLRCGWVLLTWRIEGHQFWAKVFHPSNLAGACGPYPQYLEPPPVEVHIEITDLPNDTESPHRGTKRLANPHEQIGRALIEEAQIIARNDPNQDQPPAGT